MDDNIRKLYIYLLSKQYEITDVEYLKDNQCRILLEPPWCNVLRDHDSVRIILKPREE